MDKVLELSLEAGIGIRHKDECNVTCYEELTKFYTLARADLEAENARLKYEIWNMKEISKEATNGS